MPATTESPRAVLDSSLPRLPMMAISEIGVSITRSGPNLSSRPALVLNAPPYWPTSSPMRKTLSSRAISSCMAWVMASM